MGAIDNKKLNWDMDAVVEYTAGIVAKESGNVLGESQKSMVTNRVKKRMIDLGDLSPEEYYNHLKTNYITESSHLISLLTTHHTFFFREFGHFEFIIQHLDEIVQRVKARGDNKIRILSAACSRGQEVYSLSMLLNHHLRGFPGISYEIIGTDIDPESIKIAKNGVYNYSEVKSIPKVYLNGNWQRGTGDISNFAKVKKHIKENCEFDTMNLLTPERVLSGRKFDLIMCRNVFIYFNQTDIEKIVKKLKDFMHPNAYFISGLSESLKSLDMPKQSPAPSVYILEEAKTKAKESNETKVKEVSKARTFVKKPLIPKPIKLLCVDDSKSILKLLSKIFSDDPDFEVVGTAENGIQAEEFLKKNKVDAMTLDIHMPEMNGVEYLKKNHNFSHPKVVVVSSASREDSRYAMETLKHGAADFVEKPALDNLKERADEIKNKIKMSFLNDQSHVSKVEASFQKDFVFQNTENMARFFVLNFSDKNKVVATIKELRGKQPPICLFFEGNSNFLDSIKDELNLPGKVSLFEGQELREEEIYHCDAKEHLDELSKKCQGYKLTFGVFGIVSKYIEQKVIEYHYPQVLIEDTDSINESIKEIANDVFPWTSFSHVGTEYLSKK